MDDWRSMDTAPRDGTEFRARVPGHGSDFVIAWMGGFVGDTRVTVEHVDTIPLLRTGKRSPVVSEVREDFQGL